MLTTQGKPVEPLRLTLHIRGVCYLTRPIATEATDVGRAWRLKKLDGTIYDVAETDYGATCDCPDQIFRHEGLDAEGCKHIRALRSLGLIVHEPGRDEPPANKRRKRRLVR